MAQRRTLENAHHNQRLFADYYLANMLPQQWDMLRAEAEVAMQQVREVYEKFTPNPNNEAQTEDDWIKPVLRIMGHTFEVQAPLKVPGSIQKPDYIFYRDEVAREANKGPILTDELLKDAAYAVGDAKQWDRSLDRTTGGSDAFSNKNPSYQIWFYMLHSRLPWGILTNGRLWRLYHQDTAHKLEVYYEVDLPYLLESDDVTFFLYFYTFFRRAAFNDDTPLSLHQMLTTSTEYARGISESLRQQVYDALRYVAQGFLEYTRNELQTTPETCREIYDSSLILLYRLLFILYAEARDLLPLRSSNAYRHYSLHTVRSDIALHGSHMWIATTGVIWIRIKELCHIIDRGSLPLHVTTFNGGLFDATHHPFLERYVVGDYHLCRAIDKLARVGNEFIDYRDLAERHLGTIYEGLLEYTLKVAEEPMVELRGSSKIVPAEGVAQREIVAMFQTGEVYLVTNLGERKITGSYYTPDYIVKYMVEETLHPLLDAAVRDKESDAERIQAILALNVLDPSMGSGHFPVEVTEYIARYLVELGVQPEQDEEADLIYWKRRVAQQCIYGLDVNPLAVDLAKLSLWLATVASDRPLNFLDHHLRVGNALIGTWLREVSADLHPKIRQQVQKRAREVRESAEQMGQLALMPLDDEFQQQTSAALASMALIEQNAAVTVKDVKAQEKLYEALRSQFTEKYGVLANLGVALYYDFTVGEDDWRPLASYALGKLESYTEVMQAQYDALLDAVEAFNQRRHFFHWELEFPDIFFALDGKPLGEQAGFDVVIGNPPYVRQEQLGPDKPYFQEHYEVYHGKADLFVYFFAQGLKLLRPEGRLAYISSNSWLRADYASILRYYLRTQTTIETILDLGDNRVFHDAPDLTPAIQVLRKTQPAGDYTAHVAVFARNEQIKTLKEQLPGKLFDISIADQLDAGWQLTSKGARALFAKLMAKGVSLEDAVEGKIYYGIKTGYNKAFIIDQATRDKIVWSDPACATLIKPLVRGADLRPWYQRVEGRWLIWIPSGWTARTFPEAVLSEEEAWLHFQQRHTPLAHYLQPFAEDARKRQNKGQFWWELNPCNYVHEFEQPKIFWPDIVKYPRFSWDEQGYIVNDKGCILIPQEQSVLGVLQSRVCWFCVAYLCAPLGERAGLIRYQQKIQYIERLPIPPLTDVQRERIGGLARQLTEVARRRYEVRRRTAHSILRDLGTPDGQLSQKLELWWELSFQQFRAELLKTFKRDIAPKERDDWEELLRERATEIWQLTSELVRLETLLNEAAYDAFGLDAVERQLIEREAKYAYGEW